MNMHKIKKISVFIFILFLFVPIVSAHTSLKPTVENNSLDTAFNIPNPTKSWTLYREIHEKGEAEYFKLHLNEGERLVVSVYIPRNADTDFIPNLVIMGQSIETQSKVPTTIEVPDDVESTLIKGGRSKTLEYEPFTPASYYFTADYHADITVEGDYYFVIYSDEGEGRYGIAVGYVETFTLIEWLMIPIDVINIHQWEGQSLFLILVPMVLTLFLGLALMFWKLKLKPTSSVTVFLGVLAGLLYIGSGLTTITQMSIALIGAASTSSSVLTLVFSTLPALLGFLILRKIVNYDISWKKRDRLIFVVLGILGYFLWAGILLGPSLIILVSILPVKTS
jgi:hypothetical protein